MTPWDTKIQNEKILISDAEGYNLLAKNILNSCSFSLDNEKPNSLRTPIYPIFIAIIYFFFGNYPWITILFQIIISTFTIYIFYKAIEFYFNREVALFSSLIFVLEPIFILYNVYYYSDILFLFFHVLFLYSFIKYLKLIDTRKKNKQLIYSGIYLGIATLTRPASSYLIFFLLIYLILENKYCIKVIIKKVSLFLIPFIFILSPWLARNYFVFSELSISTSGNYNLLVMQVLASEVKKQKRNYKDVKNELLAQADSLCLTTGNDPKLLNDFEKSKYWKELAIEYIIKDLNGFSKALLSSFKEMTIGLGGKAIIKMVNSEKYGFINNKSSEIIINILIIIYISITYFFVIVSLVAYHNINKEFLFLAAIIVVYYVITIGTFGAMLRLKLPIIPFVSIFAGIGIKELLFFIKGRNNKSIEEQ